MPLIRCLKPPSYCNTYPLIHLLLRVNKYLGLDSTVQYTGGYNILCLHIRYRLTRKDTNNIKAFSIRKQEYHVSIHPSIHPYYVVRSKAQY